MTNYLKRRAFFPPLIKALPNPELGLVVVIPAYDEPNVILSLSALAQCAPPARRVEVIVVINDSENDDNMLKSQNQKAYRETKAWIDQQRFDWLQFHLLYCSDLPAKHAGVGLARKIGMDEACRRLEQVGRPKGILLGFDADSQCDPNYFQAITLYFQENPKIQAASIYFEHPLSGLEFQKEVYEAITLYELHLRYFINAQAWAGLPYAYQTIGSSMAVRCHAYQQQGGMNRRQAGEDFYFLHKFTPLGHFGQINTTRVIPSPRPSHRVPFGTGKAVGQLLEQGGYAETYSPKSFQLLKPFIEQAAHFYFPHHTPDLSPELEAFLQKHRWEERLREFREHTASHGAFVKRFFRWFDAFLLMKYVHYMRDHHFPNVEVGKAARWLTAVSGHSINENIEAKDLLLLWRGIDQQSNV